MNINEKIAIGCLGVFFCYLVYITLKQTAFVSKRKEGLASKTTNDSNSDNNNTKAGIAGNAAGYSAAIKSSTIQLTDVLLINKYRSDYETIILNMDDLVNVLMLKQTLSVDPDNPEEGIRQLGELNMAKTALNNVMKFVDKQ